ncbi:hypothetical protein BCR34DRAFT_477318 [Clohesyomyces aquaticus]|uniref:Nucleoporin Nup159/Nup146 N-terminal domain-containing protein n=1 Tax=Clohesyomyces aquaticus TaxID=1231657 RepID=A0A1Y2A040_9PLEO|nr:hypothetical protein BCR34DRAFT_477318 [Clohesyomyces aquaticus]
MAYAFSSPAGGAPSANAGPEVAAIETEGLGFAAFAGEKKLQILPDPWPRHSLPPSSASLLSVASRRGLLAAASPKALVLCSTDNIRKAFDREASQDNAIVDFKPDATISLPQLRQLAFSSNENFLVLAAEKGGGLAVYKVDDLMSSRTDPGLQLSTGQISVRALVPNPAHEKEQSFAVVLDNGGFILADVNQGQLIPLLPEGVSCAAWSAKGKQVVVGLKNGTAVQYTPEGEVKATIPRPPADDKSWPVSGIYWLSNDEFFIIHSPPTADPADADAMEVADESVYHFVKTEKERKSFTFSRCPYELCLSSMGPQRTPPLRFSVNRLRGWRPNLEDMLILGASNCSEFPVLTNTSAPIAPCQEVLNDYTVTALLDNRRAILPQFIAENESFDSLTIGEAVDLSSKAKILRPIPMDEEITESPTPLPAFLALNHQGRLSAWWVVYDKSIRAGTGYPSLIALSEGQESAATSTPALTSGASQPAAGSMFNKPAATFAAPTTSTFGSTGFSSGNNAPGKPVQPSFGASSFGSQPAQPAFGSPSAIRTPAFGAPSPFGAAGAIGNRTSPWATASATTPAASQTQQNPFSGGTGGASGFSKFGGSTTPGTGSAFSSFGSLGAGQSPSPFGSLAGQKSERSAFAGTGAASTAPKSLTTQPSFGSTVTVGSSMGGASTLSSWANTPAGQSGSVFGQGTSSFASTSTNNESDMGDAENRERDEATPTPQALPQPAKGLFGLPSASFSLGSTFKGDGTAKDDLPKPPAPSDKSLFGGEFASALGSSSKPPATPIKKEEEEPRLQGISTTPVSPPNETLFPSTTPKAPPAQKAASTSPAESPIGEDAPLPPDPATWKPSEKADDSLPPLAGSPGIKVEAPDSSVPSSPLGDDDEGGGDLSVEEQDEEDEEPSPSDAARKSRPLGRYTLQDSVNQSPRIFPAAPTPPVKSGASSRSDSRGPSRPAAPPYFGQNTKPGVSPLFGQSSTPTGMPKPKTIFPQQASRAQQLRGPSSPVRSASTSAIGTRQPVPRPQPTTTLSGSMQQQRKPPTPQPEVSDLSDDEDERIRQELASSIVPSRTLDSFLAHHDYTGSVTKSGIPGQIELMYRDINSMVDTLGLNARNLAAFIKYHSKPTRQDELTRYDLQEVLDQGEDGPWYEEWCLAEVDDLKTLEIELEKTLEVGKVQNVLDKLARLARLLREDSKLQTKINEVRREIINRRDPEKAEHLRKASLPKEQADQQKALRTQYANLLSMLGKVEEAVFILKSKLAAYDAVNGKTAAVPTVEAVKKTINKMIQMTEKKNNDILLLEAQMRKIGLENGRPTSSSSRNVGTPQRSRAAREVATPPTNRSRMSISELNRRAMTPEDSTPSRGYGLFYTPTGSPTQNGEHGKMGVDDLDRFDVEGLRERSLRRKKVAGTLTDALMKRGIKVTKVA